MKITKILEAAICLAFGLGFGMTAIRAAIDKPMAWGFPFVIGLVGVIAAIIWWRENNKGDNDNEAVPHTR